MGYRFGATAILLLLWLLTGCSSTQAAPSPAQLRTTDTSTLLVLNGIDGPGPWYNTLVGGLREAHAADQVEMMNWGGTLLLWPNLSSPTIHDRAERRLIERITELRRQSPNGRIILVGHSAGCGVIVKALERLPLSTKVDTVMLLAPCVGKERDLSSALTQISGTMHVFYSRRDNLLLGTSTLLTGTYDHAWTRGAGYQGFTSTADLAPEFQAKLQQHAYDPAWKKLGHSGGHFGYRERRFVTTILAPLAAGSPQPTTMPAGTARAASHEPAGNTLQ